MVGFFLWILLGVYGEKKEIGWEFKESFFMVKVWGEMNSSCCGKGSKFCYL